MNRLLHWLNFDFHKANLIPRTANRQLPFAGNKKGEAFAPPS
jgi:hypothetical protein